MIEICGKLFYAGGMAEPKKLFAIFAHPDDEAFGPSGTLYLRAQEGWDVHVICVTDGAGGGDAETRARELQAACELIGASCHQLDYADGSLCNRDYHAIAESLKKLIRDVTPNTCVIDFMTFEPHGITGHLDHIAVSYITTFIYTHWQEWAPADAMRGALHYFCVCDAQKAEDPSYFIYSPQGYHEEDVDETVSVADVLEQKKAIIRAHASQKDHIAALELGDHLLSREHFLLFEINPPATSATPLRQ